MCVLNIQAMSSIGASFAHVYVQQNAQKKKLKRMEEEGARSGKVGNKETSVSETKRNKIKKVYPSGVMPSGFTESSVEMKDDVNE